MKQIRNLRWWIVILLAAAIGLNYLDRQSFPVAVLEIGKSIPLTDRQYGNLQALFLLAYALMYAGGGKLIDLLGTRVGYAVIILWWSAATFIQGLVHSVTGLGIARVLLGLGEGGGFPGSAKAVSEWFPPKERSLAFGIFTAGSSLGAVVAVPLVAFIILTLNWRWAFFITGALGFAWLAVWWILYELPGKHRLITPGEREYILSSLSTAETVAGEVAQPRIAWVELFQRRQLWGLLLPKFFTDAAWFFLIFWLPKYLGDVRHLNIKEIGYYAWIPYAFSGIGCLAGGWLSGFLIRRRFTIDRSRKITLAMGAALMPASLLITTSPLNLAIVLFSMALFGHQFWSTILQTLAADIFPSTSVGSVAGLMGAAGSVGAMFFNYLVGILLSHYAAYPVVFTAIGLLYPLSLIIIWLMVRKIEPLNWRGNGEGQTERAALT